MIQKLLSPFRRRAVCNEAAPLAHAWLPVANDLPDPEDGWMLMAPYGEHPLILRVGNEQRDLVQVVDREGVDRMVTAFNSLVSSVRHLGRGLPIYEGHPDDPNWAAKHPAFKRVAVGRIKELQIRDDGLWGRTAWNETGRALITGEGAAYSGHSPHWDIEPIPGRPNAWRPVHLRSTGLTNAPNIPSLAVGLNEALAQQAHPSQPQPIPEPTMNPDLIRALGLDPETASQEQIDAAVKALVERAPTNTASADVAALNEQVTQLTTERDTIRTMACNTVLDAAVADGRIGTGDRAKWLTALNTDFAGESAKLGKLMPVINTANQVGNLGERKAEGQDATLQGIAAINEAVTSYARKEGLDLGHPADYDAAHAAVRSKRPELFAH